MSDSDGWLERYDESHQNLAFPIIYCLSAALAILGAAGLLWSMPAPLQFYEISPLLNWGSAFLMAATVYYFIISLPVAIGMLPVMIAIAAFELLLERSSISSLHVSAGLMLAGSIGLWLGHRHEVGLRTLFDDLLLLMIAPAWMLSVVYRRLGIPY
jgi:hypothetical protein